jgi:hypothetical protein
MAARGDRLVTGTPSNVTVPVSGGCSPAINPSRVDASHDLDEGTLPGPVFAQKRVDLARPEVEVAVDEGAGGTEALAHPGEHQSGWLVVHGGSPLNGR